MFFFLKTTIIVILFMSKVHYFKKLLELLKKWNINTFLVKTEIIAKHII